MSTEVAESTESAEGSGGENAAVAAVVDTGRTFLTVVPQLAVLGIVAIALAAVDGTETVIFALAAVVATAVYVSLPFVQRDMVMPKGVGSVLGKLYFLSTRLVYYTVVVFVATIFGSVFAANYGLAVGAIVAAAYGIYDFEMGNVGLPISIAGATISLQRLIGTVWHVVREKTPIDRGEGVDKFRALPFNNIIFYPSVRWDSE
jgi:hypothetical protein